MMNTPAPIPKSTDNNLKENINIMNEYKLNIENINYLKKIGKITKEIEELIIFIKNENIIDSILLSKYFFIGKSSNNKKII